MGRTYIVAVGYAGAYGTADIIKEHEEELRSRYRSSFVDKMTQSCGIKEELTSLYIMPYGYLGALYELAQERVCGLRIRIRQIPVLQTTIEICELCGLNPYRLPTCGRLEMTKDPNRLMEELTDAQRRMAACIGYLTDDHDKLIVDKTHIEYINKR